LINEDILVVHGGISDKMSLEDICEIDRRKFQCLSEGLPHGELERDYEAVSAMLWSDPIERSDDGEAFWGCEFNDTRGIGTFWGPDVTEAWLDKHDLALIIRSHECMEHGFDLKHNGRVLTIFSASNYYEDGSNLAAYCILHRDRGITLQQFSTSSAHTGRDLSKTTFSKSVKKMEESAVEQLRHLLLSRSADLRRRFELADPDGSGMLNMKDWADIVQRVTDVYVPWVTVAAKLVDVCETDPSLVLWDTCLQRRALPTKNNLANGLYRNLRQMEAVFRLLDEDGSGSISVSEFQRAARVLNQARGRTGHHISEDKVKEILTAMDVDGDGVVSFNEFLEVMRNHDLA